MPPAIITTDLSKRFGALTAVDAINLEIREGEVFGLLGPNGAGKTTLINLLSTLLKATSGTALVAGRDINREPLDVRRNIGIVFQEPSVDDLLTGRENLWLHSLLYGVPRAEINGRIAKMLELVRLTTRADSFVKTYSGGMRRRLEIARGLIHRPKVLFLDEPTLGLDPASRKDVWTYIRGLKEAGDTTIILTTHYMEEADSLSDRIGIIDQGHIIELDTQDALKRKVGRDIVYLRCAPGTLEKVRHLPFISEGIEEDGRIRLTMDDSGRNLQALLKSAGDVEEVEVRRVTLDDVFLKFAGHQIKDETENHSMFERIAESRNRR